MATPTLNKVNVAALARTTNGIVSLRVVVRSSTQLRSRIRVVLAHGQFTAYVRDMMWGDMFGASHTVILNRGTYAYTVISTRNDLRYETLPPLSHS